MDVITRTVDARGQSCPGPLLESDELEDGTFRYVVRKA